MKQIWKELQVHTDSLLNPNPTHTRAGNRGKSHLLLLRARLGGDRQRPRHALLVLHVEDRPVKHEIRLEALAVKQVAKQATQVAIVRFVIEAKRAAVVEVVGELGCKNRANRTMITT